MSKQFWAFLLVGLGIVGGGLYWFLEETKGAHLELSGDILKVRVIPLGAKASLAVADFRVTNPSEIPFVVQSVELLLDPAAGESQSGAVVSKPQMETVFKAMKIVGPKYNDILSIQDRVEPRATVDRMAAARFEVPAAAMESRKGMRIRIEELHGVVIAEIRERPGTR